MSNATVSTPLTSPPTALSVDGLNTVKAFAEETVRTGETPFVRELWEDHYRVNYYLRDKGIMARSLFVIVSDGQAKVSERQ